MSELTRNEIKALLEKSAELIRQANAIQGQLEGAIKTASVPAKRPSSRRRKTTRKTTK